MQPDLRAGGRRVEHCRTGSGLDLSCHAVWPWAVTSPPWASISASGNQGLDYFSKVPLFYLKEKKESHLLISVLSVFSIGPVT